MSGHDLPLLLVRHAVAEDEHPLGDEARALSPEGRAAFRLHARKLTRLTPLMGIITSPLVRSVQTAEILAEAVGLARVEVHPALLPLPRAHKHILALADELGPGWALVGHNPSLEKTAARALGLKHLPEKLRKGAALALFPESNHFRFGWLAAPGRAVVRRLAADG